MKKLISLLVVIAAIGTLSGVSVARIICDSSQNCFNQTTNPPTSDLWAVGGQKAGGTVKGYTEIVLDYTGSLYPTSTKSKGSQTLGTSSFPWLAVYATTMTTGGGGINASAGPATLQIQTTTQLAADAYPVGTFTLVEESTGVTGTTINYVTNAYNACVTTSAVASVGSSNAVYVIASTNTSSGVAVGVACTK